MKLTTSRAHSVASLPIAARAPTAGRAQGRRRPANDGRLAISCGRQLRRVLVVGSAFLAAATASTTAAAIDLFIVTHSNAIGRPCPGIANCLDIVVSGVADDFAGLSSPIPDAWNFALSYRQINGIGSGLWSYTDTGPAGNNLFGTSTSTSVPLTATVLKDTAQFIITGGGGLFAGATGTGQATAYVNTANGTSVDSTWLSVTTVPEPSTTALMAAGLVAAGALVRRRRDRCASTGQ